jgi:hypothetical protein
MPVTSLDQVVKTPPGVPQKLVTIMNNSPNVVYPILIDANSTLDKTQGQVVRIKLDKGGNGYDSAHPPQVVFKPAGASAKAFVNGDHQVYALQLEGGGGFGQYTSAPAISFDDNANGNKGSGAMATATISVLQPGDKPTALYDPLDNFNEGYRGYIGEVDPNNPAQVDAGLQPYSQVTVQLPLVFWDGARIFFATNGGMPLQSASDPGNPIQDSNLWKFSPQAPAYMPLPDTPYSATFADPATKKANPNGRVLWYHDGNGSFGGPHGFADDAPGQTTEYTIRDPMQVTWAPDMPQSQLDTPIFNYDVSYVDELGLPAMMETTDGYPATNPEIGTAPYAGIGADLSDPQMLQLITAFTQSDPAAPNTLLGQYFGGKGYDHFVIPDSITDFNLLPGGYNLFLDSALADSESVYNPTNPVPAFKLVSGGAVYRADTNSVNGNGVVTVGSPVVTGLDPKVVAGLVKGMLILNSGAGPGNTGNFFSAGTYITSVDVVNNTVTLSSNAYFSNAGNGTGTFSLTFLGSKWTSATGSTDGHTSQVTGIDPNAGQYLSPGMLVTGPGITSYATISQLITTNNQVTGVMLVDPAGNPYTPASGSASGATPYAFLSGPSSYLARTLINNWYAWADYYVQNVNATAQSGMGSTTGTNNLMDPNALILSGLDPSVVSQLKVGDVVSGPNIAQNRATAALIAIGGSGYMVNDVLTVSGGTFTTAATLTVAGVDSMGAITGVLVAQGGSYSAPPSGPVSVTGGHGTGATFNLTFVNTTIARIIQAIAGGGSGYMVNDVLTVTGGTFTTAATLTVTGVSGTGVVTGVSVAQGGSYSIPPSGPVSVSGGHGSGASFNLVFANNTTATIPSSKWIQLSNAVLESATGLYKFSPPLPIARSSDAPAFGTNTLTFDSSFKAPYGETPLEFAQTVYDVMTGFGRLPPSGSLLSQSGQLLSYCIGCNIGAFGGNNAIPVVRDDQLRDELKSIMRGVSDFAVFPEFGTSQNPSPTSLWYPDPKMPVTGALLNGTQSTFNVFNLSPYVYFVHKVLGMNGYGFSVDDDTADVGSLGSNLEIAFGGTSATAPGTAAQRLQNLNYYTSGTPYGTLQGEGSVDSTSAFGLPYREQGFTVLKLPTAIVARLVAADPTVAGALVTASDGSLQPGTRVVNIATTVNDPNYGPGLGAVIVSMQNGPAPTQNGQPPTYTFAGFNTLLPVVSNFTPSSGAAGTQVSITGSNFAYLFNGATVGAVLSVTFNGIPVPATDVTVNSDSSITVAVPTGATSGRIGVRSAAGTGYSTRDFTVPGLGANATGGFVTALYGDVLDRDPDAQGMAGWVAFLQAGGTRQQVAQGFWESAEHRGLQVDQFYQTYLHRAADPLGRAFWVGALQGGMSEEQVEAGFLTSQEYLQTHATATAYLSGLYNDVLGRAPDVTGLDAWQAAVQGGLSRAALAMDFLQSIEDDTEMVAHNYSHYLGRTGQSGEDAGWVALLQSGQLTPAQVAEAFLASDEFFAKAV